MRIKVKASFSTVDDYSESIVTHSLNNMFSAFTEKAAIKLYFKQNLPHFSAV